MTRARIAYTTTLCTVAIGLASTELYAEALNKQYQAPTRGFFIEHASVYSGDYASVELHTGDNTLDAGGGIRLGLPQAELILNSGTDNYSANTNEALIKWGLPLAQTQQEERSNTDIKLALIGGIAITNQQNGIDQANLKLGAAATISADAGTFTAAPYLVIADSDDNGGVDDTFLEVDLGAYVGLIDTPSGLFSAGLEFSFSSQDNVDEQIALGARWLYNEKINLDLVPLIFNNNDVRGLPGLVRLNIVF